LDLRHYVVTGGTGSRNVEFTEWSHGMHVTKFTESLADGTAVAHFEYNRDTLQFDSVGTPGVAWKYEPPDGFLVVGDYPVIAQSATGITTVSHVLQIPTAEYTASTLGEALELALNSKTQVLHLPLSYKCVTTGSELEVKLQYNGSDVRYSYQGLWRETTTSPSAILSAHLRVVWRDYRHLRADVALPEYILSPSYNFNGLGFSATLNNTFGIASHTGTVVAPDLSLLYSDMVSVTTVDNYGASTTLKIHWRSDLTDSIKHFGGRPALAWKLELILSSGTFTDAGHVKYHGATRRIRLTSQLLGGIRSRRLPLTLIRW
jgi:hypothetical protein